MENALFSGMFLNRKKRTFCPREMSQNELNFLERCCPPGLPGSCWLFSELKKGDFWSLFPLQHRRKLNHSIRSTGSNFFSFFLTSQWTFMPDFFYASFWTELWLQKNVKKLEVENIRNCHHQKSGGIVDFFLGHNSVQNAAIFTFFCVQNVLGKMSWSEREHYCVVIGGSYFIPVQSIRL